MVSGKVFNFARMNWVALEVYRVCLESRALSLVLVTGIFIGLIKYWMYSRTWRMTILNRHGIPGLEPGFLTGNMKEYDGLPNVLFDSELIRRFGQICGYYLGAKPVILLQNADVIQVMQSKMKRHFLARPRRVPGGINPCPRRKLMLGNLPVEEWQKMRRILAPAFSSHNLSAMLEGISGKVSIFMGLLEEKTKAGEVQELDFYPLFQHLALDIIGKTAFGLDSDIQTCQNDKLLQAVQAEFTKSISGTLVQVYLSFPELTPVLSPIRQWWQKILNFGGNSSSALWEMGKQAVRDQEGNLEKSYQKNGIISPEKSDTPPADDPYSEGSTRKKVYHNLLSHLMNPAHKLSQDSIVANTVLIFEAAYETTSACLGFMVHLLAHKSRVQKKIRREIRKAVKHHDLNSFAGLQSLKFLEACIYEALRLYPTQTTFIGRSADEDIPLSMNGKEIVIPKGVHVQLALYQIHRSGEYWKQPNKFLPQRFLSGGEDKEKLKSAVYQAFGHGPRECIGKGFAIMTLKFILASLLSKYKLVPSDRTEGLNRISIQYKTATMTPAKGSYARAIPLSSK